jgi:hypothetical protein
VIARLAELFQIANLRIVFGDLSKIAAHYEIVNHMHSKIHLGIVISSLGQINGIPQAEIKNMLLGRLRN